MHLVCGEFASTTAKLTLANIRLTPPVGGFPSGFREQRPEERRLHRRTHHQNRWESLLLLLWSLLLSLF